MENWKQKVIQGVICIVLLCAVWGGYFALKISYENRAIEISWDDFSWVYQVDSVKTEGKDFVLQGFAFELKNNSEKGAFEIVLQDIESGKKYFPKMEYVERTDVNEYFLCEYDYSKSGFAATIKTKRLDLNKNNYEVLLRVSGERQAYHTGIYISDGKLMYAKPTEFEPLDVLGTDLEKIVTQGVLRVYRPDYKMYVYQYDGELYWIAEKDYGFVNGDTYVQYQLNTTQVGMLPAERLENGWNWDNIGFMFSTNEQAYMNVDRYRVAKKSIPTNYAIERIWTGNHVDEWIWRQEFRPYYFFK